LGGPCTPTTPQAGGQEEFDPPPLPPRRLALVVGPPPCVGASTSDTLGRPALPLVLVIPRISATKPPVVWGTSVAASPPPPSGDYAGCRRCELKKDFRANVPGILAQSNAERAITPSDPPFPRRRRATAASTPVNPVLLLDSLHRIRCLAITRGPRSTLPSAAPEISRPQTCIAMHSDDLASSYPFATLHVVIAAPTAGFAKRRMCMSNRGLQAASRIGWGGTAAVAASRRYGRVPSPSWSVRRLAWGSMRANNSKRSSKAAC
jgi:hypothetical protein